MSETHPTPGHDLSFRLAERAFPNDLDDVEFGPAKRLESPRLALLLRLEARYWGAFGATDEDGFTLLTYPSFEEEMEDAPWLGRVGTSASARLALWLVVGAHSHYFFVQYAAWSGLALVAWALLSRRTLAPIRPFVVPLVVAALACTPWYATGFREQLAHALPPGGKDAGLTGWAEAQIHLFFLNLRLGGPTLRLVFIASGAALFGLACWGIVSLARRAPRAPLTWLLFAAGLFVPAAAAAVAANWERAGFTWHYVLPSTAAMALLASQGLGAGPLQTARRAALTVSLGACVLLSLLNARGPGSEDFPGAVRHLASLYRPGDAVVAVEWQPNLFPQHQPLRYYAPRVAPELPEALPMNRHYSLARPADLDAFERVLLLRTDLPDTQHLMGLLRERFQQRSRRRLRLRRAGLRVRALARAAVQLFLGRELRVVSRRLVLAPGSVGVQGRRLRRCVLRNVHRFGGGLGLAARLGRLLARVHRGQRLLAVALALVRQAGGVQQELEHVELGAVRRHRRQARIEAERGARLLQEQPVEQALDLIHQRLLEVRRVHEAAVDEDVAEQAR